MKRYRLKKDLPTFNIGDTFHISPKGSLVSDNEYSNGIVAYARTTLAKFPSILTDWFEEIKDEPLFKDEKVRKAIRAWADANGVKLVRIVGVGTLRCEHTGVDIEFEGAPFVGWVTELKTIAELCGEKKAPEPLEPTFVDLDERIREKEEE